MKRSEKAKATLDHEYIKEALKDIRDACFKNISLSSHDQNELREDMYYMLKAVTAFERVLKSHIDKGKVDNLNEVSIKRMIR